MILKQVAEMLAQIQDPHFELVKRERPYKIPKGYIRWELICAAVAMGLRELAGKNLHNADTASRLNHYRSALWFVQDAPVYSISIELRQGRNAGRSEAAAADIPAAVPRECNTDAREQQPRFLPCSPS